MGVLNVKLAKIHFLGTIVFALLFVFPLYTLRGEVINISNSSNWKSTYPRIAVDPGDFIHVVWVEKYSDNQGDLFYTSSDSPGSQWGTPLNLSNNNQVYSESRTACDIDADDFNRIYATWIENHLIKMRIYSDGEWGSPFEVASSQEGLDTVSIAVSPAGNIYLVWWSNSGQVFSRARVDSVWEDSKRISVSGKRSKFPRIAVGNQLVYSCWAQKNQAIDQYEIAYASRGNSLHSSWSSVEEVYPNGLTTSYPAVAVDSLDVPTVIWTSLINGSRVVHSSRWAGSGFSPPVAISETRLLHYASLFEQYGDLYACWQVGGYEAGLAIYYNQYQNGSWSDESAVSQSDGSTFSDISASPNAGKTYLTWDSNDEIYFTSIDSTPISNIPPVADFVFSPETGEAPMQVSFNASLSYDSDGQIDQYSWDFGDGSSEEGKIVDHIYEQGGNFSISLLVKDNEGAAATKTKTIEVFLPNKSPVADFVFSPETGETPLQVTFDASLSFDSDGQIDQYSWDFGDGTTGLGKIVDHTYEQNGNFSISLLVKDNQGAVDTEIKTIEVFLPNEPPVADFNFSPQTGLFPLQVIFDASSSLDPDGQIVRYSWDFGDNTSELGKIVTHTFESWGTFTITLSIEDNRGDGDTKTKTIEVLRLFQPLNIRWETFKDESMFLTRYIVNVKWEKNPSNNEIAEVVLYRIYRKENHADPASFKYIGKVGAQIFTYDDYDIEKKDKYSYTVTSVDSQGHESPIVSSSSNLKGAKKSHRIKILK